MQRQEAQATAPGTGRRGWAGRLARVPPVAIDAALATALACVVTMAAVTSEEPDSRPSVAAAYGLGAAVGALTLLRRRWPATVLVLTAAVLLAYHTANFPAIGTGWPLMVALYTCAAQGRLRPAIVTVAVTFGIGGAAWLLTEPEPLLPVLTAGVQELAGVGLALAFGDAVRSRRGWAAEHRERIRRLEHEREQETTRRIVEERVRIARELHDVTAHTLAVASVQLNVAVDTLADSPEQARDSLRTAQQANREAVAELKAAVRVLRRDNDGGGLPRSPTPGPDGVERVLAAAREAGLRVEYQQVGPEQPVSAPVGLAVYRLVQESVTNVLRHAQASVIRVEIGYGPTGLEVRIVDDGRGCDGAADVDEPGGLGLIGLRERVRGLGGRFSAGPAAAGGFAVSAWIPTGAGS